MASVPGGFAYYTMKAGSKSSVQTSVPPPTSIRANIPQATVGGVVPYVIGRRRISQPNVIGYGNLRALTETTVETTTQTREIPGRWNGPVWTPAQTVEETTTTETTVPIGFLTDIIAGICLGPGVVLKGIYVGAQQIWSGTVGPTRATFTLPVNDTAFSGCEVSFNGGAFDQPVDPWTLDTVDPSTPIPVASIFTAEGERNAYVDDEKRATARVYGASLGPWTPSKISPFPFQADFPTTAGSVIGEANYWPIHGIWSSGVTTWQDGPGTYGWHDVIAIKGNTVSRPSFHARVNGGTWYEFIAPNYDPVADVTNYAQAISPGVDSSVFDLANNTAYTLEIQEEGPLATQDYPAYVGVAYMVFRGMRADMSLDSLSFEVERFPNPLGLTANQNRLDDDINCATAIYELLTSDWGGAGLGASGVDLASAQAAALVFAAEANYCAVLIDAETSATGVLGSLQGQTYSVVYQNPGTGKIEIKPIRQTLNPANARAFGKNNIIEIRSLNKDSWASTMEVLRGVYVERANDYEPTPVMVQSIGSLSTTGRAKRSGEVAYPHVTKADLTLFLVSRDLAYVSVPRFSMTVLTNRDGALCLPGDVVLVSDAEYEFWSVPMVVDKVRKAPLRENHVLLTLSEYSLPSTSPIYDTPSDPYDPGIDYSPQTPLGALAVTAPFWVVSKTTGLPFGNSSNVVYPLILPVPANDLQAYYDVHINNVPGVGQVQAQTGGLFATYGQLVDPISRWDGIADGNIATVEIDSVVNAGLLSRTFSDDDQRQGKPLVFIGNEIFSFSSATQLGPDNYRLNLVKRGLIDTVPLDHSAGAHVFITGVPGGSLVPTAFDYPLSYTPQWRLVSSTVNEKGRYANAFAFSGWNSANMPRTLRPIRPHDTKLEGVRSQTPQTVVPGEDYTVTWRTRARSSLQIPFQTDAAEPSEATGDQEVVFHRVYIRDGNNTLRLCGSTTDAANANSLTVTIPIASFGGAGTLFVRSVNQYGESLFDDTLPIEIWTGSSRQILYTVET